MLRIVFPKRGYRNQFNMKLKANTTDILIGCHQTKPLAFTTSALPMVCRNIPMAQVSSLKMQPVAAFCTFGEEKSAACKCPDPAMAPNMQAKQSSSKIGGDSGAKVETVDQKTGEANKANYKESADTTSANDPHQVRLPNKEQVEKYFFRVVAFVYDVSYLMVNWTIKNTDQHIVKNETVQLYWKKFHEKMANAKKD